jgi:hypothetical protein
MNGDEEVILDDDENVHEVLKEKFREDMRKKKH